MDQEQSLLVDLEPPVRALSHGPSHSSEAKRPRRHSARKLALTIWRRDTAAGLNAPVAGNCTGLEKDGDAAGLALMSGAPLFASSELYCLTIFSSIGRLDLAGRNWSDLFTTPQLRHMEPWLVLALIGDIYASPCVTSLALHLRLTELSRYALPPSPFACAAETSNPCTIHAFLFQRVTLVIEHAPGNLQARAALHNHDSRDSCPERGMAPATCNLHANSAGESRRVLSSGLGYLLSLIGREARST